MLILTIFLLLKSSSPFIIVENHPVEQDRPAAPSAVWMELNIPVQVTIFDRLQFLFVGGLMIIGLMIISLVHHYWIPQLAEQLMVILGRPALNSFKSTKDNHRPTDQLVKVEIV